MATKRQQEDIAAATDRVRTLTAAGDTDAAEELVQETEDLIRSTRPVRDHDGYLKLLKDAATPPNAGASLATLSTADLDPEVQRKVEELKKAGVARVREAAAAGMRLVDAAVQLAHILLETRLQMRNKAGLPDLLGSSKLTKNKAHEMYTEARSDVAADDVDRLAAHKSIAKAVRNKTSDVMVEYLRSLDNNPDEFRERFPRAAAEYPDHSPTDAVYALYEANGFTLPRKGRTEVMREESQRRAELARAAEAGETVEDEDGASPIEQWLGALDRVTVSVSKATRRADQLTGEERAKLKASIQATITNLAAEAQKL